MRDITAAAEQVYLEAIRRQEPTQRLRQALAFSEWARRLALASLAERFPERTQLELVEILLGNALVPVAARPPRP
jgi:hypothetical protein